MARLFNGSTDRLNGTAPISAYPLTVAYWGRVSTTSGTQVAVVESAASSPDSNQFFSLYLNGATASCFATPSDSTAGTVSTNTWFHHAAVIASTTSNTTYLNGTAGSTTTTSITANTPANLYVGQGASGSGLAWNGDIAEIAIWNVALTAAEISSLAAGASPLMVRPSALVSYNPVIGRYSPEIDLRGAMPLTLSGTTASDHPRVFKPRRKSIGTKAAAGADRNITAAQTLPNLTSSATVRSIASITSAATIPNLTSSASINAQTTATITASPTLPNLTSSATVKGIASLTSAATIPNLTQAVTVKGLASLTSAATLQNLTSAAEIAAGTRALTSAATLPNLTSSASVTATQPVGITSAATLPNLTSSATIQMGHVIDVTWTDTDSPSGSWTPKASASATWAAKSRPSTTWTRRV